MSQYFRVSADWLLGLDDGASGPEADWKARALAAEEQMKAMRAALAAMQGLREAAAAFESAASGSGCGGGGKRGRRR